MIMQLISQKLFRAMITRASHNPARNNSKEVFWRDDRVAIAQIDPWRHATKTVRKQRAPIRLPNRPENNFPRVIPRNRLWQFRAMHRKMSPQCTFRTHNVSVWRALHAEYEFHRSIPRVCQWWFPNGVEFFSFCIWLLRTSLPCWNWRTGALKQRPDL